MGRFVGGVNNFLDLPATKDAHVEKAGNFLGSRSTRGASSSLQQMYLYGCKGH